MAKRVLVTLPIGVLKSMPDLITPPISKAKADAIQNLGMGTYMKIYLKFESAWWSKESKEDEASSSSSFNFNPFIGIIDEVSDGIGCIFDYNACKGVPVLLAIAPNKKGKFLHSKSDAEVVDYCMKSISKLPSLLATTLSQSPIAHHVVRWDSDEFSQGAYSYLQYGADDDDCESMATPEANNTIYFAGEGTSLEGQGTLHGAINTGKLQAQIIAASLSDLSVNYENENQSSLHIIE